MKHLLPLLLLMLFSGGARAQSAPLPRVMAADFCADQFLLALGDPEQIAALSVDAEKDFSYMRTKATGFKQARPDLEQIARFKPDVVLRFWGGDGRALARSKAQIVTLGYAVEFDAVRANIRMAATAIGQEQRAEKMITEMDARLAALAEREGDKKQALYVTPGGVTAGAGTMIDAIFNAAGILNIAAEKGLKGWPPLPAEQLVLDPPKMIVSGFFRSNSEHVNHWSATRHPVLRKLFASTPSLHLETGVLSCPAWFSVDAAEAIADFSYGAHTKSEAAR